MRIECPSMARAVRAFSKEIRTAFGRGGIEAARAVAVRLAPKRAVRDEDVFELVSDAVILLGADRVSVVGSKGEA